MKRIDIGNQCFPIDQIFWWLMKNRNLALLNFCLSARMVAIYLVWFFLLTLSYFFNSNSISSSTTKFVIANVPLFIFNKLLVFELNIVYTNFLNYFLSGLLSFLAITRIFTALEMNIKSISRIASNIALINVSLVYVVSHLRGIRDRIFMLKGLNHACGWDRYPML